MPRVGLAGFGSIAERGHLPAWRSLGFDVVAVADISSARLARAQSLLPGAQIYESAETLLLRADVDVVDICSPPQTHVQLIYSALKRGVTAIVCEKPLVLSEDEYLLIARRKREGASRVISVNNWVHSDLNHHVLEALSRGSIGAIETVELHTGRPDSALGSAAWLPHWRTSPQHSGGGVILDHGWHQLYLLLGWVQQPIQALKAVTRTVNPRHAPVEDEACISLEFPDATGRIQLSWAAAKRSNGGRIQGSHGVIAICDDRLILEQEGGRQEVAFGGKLTETSYNPHWFEAVFEGNVVDESRLEADRNFSEAGVLVSAIQAAYASARWGGNSVRPAFPTVESVGGMVDEKAELRHGCSDSGATTA